jgi:hypothetical protein
MDRSALSRCIPALSLSLILCSTALAPAWAAGNTPRPQTAGVPAAATVQHPGAMAALSTWLQALAGKVAGRLGGHRFVVDKGICIDPNGLPCTAAAGN